MAGLHWLCQKRADSRYYCIFPDIAGEGVVKVDCVESEHMANAERMNVWKCQDSHQSALDPYNQR